MLSLSAQNNKENEILVIEREKNLLSCLLVNNNTVDKVDFIKPNYFLDPFHAEIFATITNLIKKERLADVANVSLELSHRFANRDIKTSMEEIYHSISLIATPRQLANEIYDFYLKRSLVEVAKKIATEAYTIPVSNIREAYATFSEEVFSIHEVFSTSSTKHIGEVMATVKNTFNLARKGDGAISGIPSGFADVDRILGGFKSNDLVIIAGRPSMGKTAFALTIAYHVAIKLAKNPEGGSVGFFSLEMSSEQLAIRLAALHTKKNSKIFETGYIWDENGEINEWRPITDEEFNEISKTMDELNNLPLYIDSTPSVSISSLRHRIRKMAKRNNIKLVVVDYLQLLKGDYNNSSNRVQEVAEISQGLKSIAKEIGIPVIALSQLSRAVEGRDDKRPSLADLRESGSIEQDADVVMMLYRESYYLTRSCPANPGERPTDPAQIILWEEQKTKYENHKAKIEAVAKLAEVIVAKNRNGATGNIELEFNPKQTSFTDPKATHIATEHGITGKVTNPWKGESPF